MKHTPGPWTPIAKPWMGIDGPHRMIGAPDGITCIAAAFGDDDVEIDANARLIAAAPAMRVALQDTEMELVQMRLAYDIGTNTKQKQIDFMLSVTKRICERHAALIADIKGGK